ncbi:MAG TPA: AAA family ATPase [Trebonia sp.]|nr:AAA family ATPase [Trebonia sp.]
MSGGIVSPVFVGRDQELAMLAAAMATAGHGDPVFALVGGEAGIGKTRLTEELAARAGAAGFTVLTGNCVELGAEGLPLAPVISALRALSRILPPPELAGVVGPAAGGLSRLLPELAPPDGPAVVTAHADSAVSLPELVAGLLGRLCVLRPVLLVIEDLHWADQSTLELTAYLVRTLREIPLLAVVTFRSDELHRRHPLHALLTGWERVRSTRRIELGSLDRAEVADQLTGILGAPPEPHLADLIFDRSGGNTYLVEELASVASHLGRPGRDADLPPSLRDVLLHRADSLSPAAQRVLRAASANGRRVAEGLLAAVAGIPEAELYPALREAVDGHLLVVDATSTGYEFRHALTREAVYEDMLPGERARLHAAYAEALAADPGLADDDAAVPAALAHHWYSAHVLPRALPALLTAASHALGSYAPAESLRHLERALEIWPRIPDAAGRAGITLAEVCQRAADAAFLAGVMDRSLALSEQGMAALSAGPGPGGGPGAALRAQLLERRAMALRDIGREDEAIAALRQALALLPEDEPSQLRPMLLSSLAGTLMRVDDMAGAAQAARRAVAAARAAGAAREEADALISAGGASLYLGPDDAGLADLRAGLDLALRADYPATALRGYINLTDALQLLGRHAEAIEVAGQGRALADRAGRPRMFDSFLAGNMAISAVQLGRWPEAERLTAENLRTAPDGIYQVLHLQSAAGLATRRGDYPAAADLLRRARKEMGASVNPHVLLPIIFEEALARHGQGDLAGARELLTSALAEHTGAVSVRHAWPLLWLGMRTTADEAVRARDRRAPAEAEPAAAAAGGLADLAARLPARHSEARGYQALFDAERARGSSSDTPRLWSAALAFWRDLRVPYLTSYCLLRYAEALLAAGDRGAAARAIQEAHLTAAGLGAAPIAAQAEALARRARLSLDEGAAAQEKEAAASRAAAGPADELGRLGLTDREREVLLQLAAGRSNAQIARALFISPKTAGVHVSNILAKLGVAGRVEAAAVAHRLGLTGPAER